MPFGRHSLVRAPFFLATLALVAAGHALADDYADVGALVRNGRSAEALAKADQYLAAKPRDPQMRFLKGVILTDTGRAADAVGVFTALTQEFPELPEPYNNLAVLHAGQGQWDKARTALEMAVRVNPGYATAHENLGDIHARLAVQAWARAQQLDPQLASSVAPKLTLVREIIDGVKAKAVGARPRLLPAPVAAPATRPASR